MATAAGYLPRLSGGRPHPRRRYHEDKLQISFNYLLRQDFRPEDLIYAHCPNGGLRSKPEAAKLKAMGVLAGISDLLFWWPVEVEEDGKISLWLDSGFIEVKTPDGELSIPQQEFRDRVRAMGGKYAVARKYETLRDTLISWGVKCQHRVHL